MADGKWLSGLWAETPVSEAARTTLTARFGSVRHYLPLAAEKSEDDVEYVHQLRVATRRAGAALRVFTASIPERKSRKARRLLRNLRRAAGVARDWDVFLMEMAQTKPAKNSSAQHAIEFLTGYALGLRVLAQEQLVETARANSDRLDQFLEQVPELTETPKENATPHTLSDLGSETMPGLLKLFDDAAKGSPRAPESLHQLRITGKRLRYAMELFASCYAPAFRAELYPAVERVQGILGTIQDCHVAIERLRDVSTRLKKLAPTTARRVEPGLGEMIQETRNRSLRENRHFRSWVREWKELSANGFKPFLLPGKGPPAARGSTRPRATR